MQSWQLEHSDFTTKIIERHKKLLVIQLSSHKKKIKWLPNSRLTHKSGPKFLHQYFFGANTKQSCVTCLPPKQMFCRLDHEVLVTHHPTVFILTNQIPNILTECKIGILWNEVNSMFLKHLVYFLLLSDLFIRFFQSKLKSYLNGNKIWI